MYVIIFALDSGKSREIIDWEKNDRHAERFFSPVSVLIVVAAQEK